MPEEQRRIGVLDVGCFTATAVVVDLDGDSLLHPVLSRKFRLRLDLALEPAGRIDRDGMHRIAAAVRQAQRAVDRVGGAEVVVPFATSTVRDAVNAAEVLKFVAKRTGVELRTFTGDEEAALSYLAARRWFGSSAGGLVVLDIGSGTVELAAGGGEQPSFTRSAPLGAKTLADRWSAGPRPTGKRVRKAVAELAEVLGAAVPEEARASGSTRAVACSKVFRQLARLAGARPQRDGLFVPRRLHAAALTEWIPRLAAMSPSQRAKLPGISRHRAPHALAGAVVAAALMRATGHESVDLCPWSTREGLLLASAPELEDCEPPARPRSLGPRATGSAFG